MWRASCLIITVLVAGLTVTVAVSAQETASGLIAQGASLFQQQRYDAALAKFLRAAQLEPRNADAHAWLGRTYLQKALLEFKTVARLAPDSDNGRVARRWIERIEGTGAPRAPSGGPPTRPAGPRVVSLSELPAALGRPYFEKVTLFGQVYEKAFVRDGCDTMVSVVYNINRQYARFEAVVGMADNKPTQWGAVARVLGDGQLLFESPKLRSAEVPVPVNVVVKGVLRLELVTVPDDCGQVVWGNPRLIRE